MEERGGARKGDGGRPVARMRAIEKDRGRHKSRERRSAF